MSEALEERTESGHMSLAMACGRPLDYLLELQPKYLRRLMNDIGRPYAEHWREDCVSQVLTKLVEATSELRLGPPLSGVRNEQWYGAARAALLALARSETLRASVLKAAYKNRGIPVPTGSMEQPDPNWEQTLFWSERRADLMKVLVRLRRYICEQRDSDAYEICLFDQLRKNAEAEPGEPADRKVFRGKTFQIVRETLLESLRREFPTMNWNMQVLNVTIDRFCRHMEKHRDDLTREGFLSISSSRQSGSSKGAAGDQKLSGKQEVER